MNCPFSGPRCASQRRAFVLQVTPIISDEGVTYLYVQYSNLYLLIVTRENVNAASMLLFLHKLREVFVHYFNELEEESLRDNFVIAYELLDEVTSVFLAFQCISNVFIVAADVGRICVALADIIMCRLSVMLLVVASSWLVPKLPCMCTQYEAFS